ncbi:Uncharacterised protein [uncultured archaeon]|nr:Uncharacterised protein [uncultured archaeon]
MKIRLKRFRIYGIRSVMISRKCLTNKKEGGKSQ